MDGLKPEKITRKPLPSAPPSPSPSFSDILDDYFDDRDGDDYALAARTKDLSLATRPSMPARPATLPLIRGPLETPTASQVEIAWSESSESPSASKSFWKNAVDETVFFAGGLVSHPFESNKHFSILRHSSGLVYYKGPSTRVVISIYSDGPLPPDRTLWLQQKGFSGNMGMNASAMLGTASNWIDVTPASEGLLSEVPESDERGWQRDMKKFSKKVAKHKHLSRQSARETCVVRVPSIAQDGYLRIVMCTGDGRKKVLCPSPVFRIASTSSDVSILRGASLSTMPLEAGLKVASVVGTNVVNRYVGPAKMVVLGGVTKYTDKVTSKYKPNFIEKRAEHVALAKSGLQSQFQSLEQNFDGARHVSYDPLHAQDIFDSDAPPELVGHDAGPEQPFPIRFDGKVEQGTSQGQKYLGIPTANLSGVAGDLLLRLGGIYIGWASVQPRKGLDGVSHDWHEAIITIGPSPYAAPRVVSKNVATVHIIRDFGEATFFDAKVKVVIMAFLRPLPRPDKSRSQTDELAAAVGRDINIAVASLSREHWAPEMTIQRLKTEKSNRKLADKYVEARTQVQKRVDSVPLHWAGVRTPGADMRDRAHGNGGFWIPR